MTYLKIFSVLLLTLFCIGTEALVLKSAVNKPRDLQPRRLIQKHFDAAANEIGKTQAYKTAKDKGKPIVETVGKWHMKNWFMFIIYGVIILWLIIRGFRKKSSGRMLYGTNIPRLSVRKLGSEFRNLMRMRRSGQLNRITSSRDFNSINMRRNIFYMADGISKRIMHRRLSQHSFDKEYPRMVGFMTNRARKLRSFGLGELMKMVNDYSKTYKGVDLMKNKMFLMMNLGRLMNSLPAAMNLFNN